MELEDGIVAREAVGCHHHRAFQLGWRKTKANEHCETLTAMFGTASFDCYTTGSKPKIEKKAITSSTKLVERYMDDERVQLCNDPLEWWRKNEAKHPEVPKLAKLFYLGIPATSVSFERTSSTVGLVTVKKRNRLKLKTASVAYHIEMCACWDHIM